MATLPDPQAALHALSRELVMANDVESLSRISVHYLQQLLGTEVALLVSRSGSKPVPTASSDPTGALAEAALASAPEVSVLPMLGARGAVGIVAIRRARPAENDLQRSMLETMVAQTALAIERAQLAAEAEQAHVFAETERTRNTLLAGLSHDLRTPLAAIAVSAGALLDSDAALAPGEQRALLSTIRDEAQKLTRMVTSLLDLVNIESGRAQVVKEWCPLEEILSSALSRLERALGSRAVKTMLGGGNEMLMVAADPILLEQVFINLVDNAAKYSPPGSTIQITAETAGDMLRIDVADEGRGISPGDEKRVFEKFYRSERSSRECSGAGLGLAVCEAIVRAHDGRIEVSRRSTPGAVFSIYLPNQVPPSTTTNKLGEGSTA